MTAIIESPEQWQNIRRELKGKIGLVPTMGALHAGHASLLKKCREENEIAVLSLFVNPTQFDDTKDLKNYPKTFDADLKMANDIGIDYLFFPEANALYPDNYTYRLNENTFSRELCGRHRPGHFDGVLTIVMKLLLLIRPHQAYFGEKDYQQYVLIKNMAEAFFLDTKIIPCPIIREPDGLAMSSRNVRLTAEQRKLAPKFPIALTRKPGNSHEIRRELEAYGFMVDYIEEREGRRFGAVRLGEVRLIDNVKIG